MLMNDIIYLQIRGDDAMRGRGIPGKTLNMGGEGGQKKRGRKRMGDGPRRDEDLPR